MKKAVKIEGGKLCYSAEADQRRVGGEEEGGNTGERWLQGGEHRLCRAKAS